MVPLFVGGFTVDFRPVVQRPFDCIYNVFIIFTWFLFCYFRLF